MRAATKRYWERSIHNVSLPYNPRDPLRGRIGALSESGHREASASCDESSQDYDSYSNADEHICYRFSDTPDPSQSVMNFHVPQ